MIPTEETQKARDLYKVGRYADAVAAAKAALNKNERYTPAMLVMAKSYYKLHKYEWMKKLWEMMQANGASERREGRDLPAARVPRGRREERPGRDRAVQAGRRGQARRRHPVEQPRRPVPGGQELHARRRRCSSAPSQLQPGFAKAHLNLGDAYRGLKEYERAQEEYQKALQLFPNYADAVFNLGILYLDADKMPNMDLFAKQNTAIQYFQKYKQMMGGTLPAVRPRRGLHRRGAGQDQEGGEAPRAA